MLCYFFIIILENFNDKSIYKSLLNGLDNKKIINLIFGIRVISNSGQTETLI